MSVNVTIYNPPKSGGAGGVTSLNSETGDINLVAGTGISITPAGQNITITNTATGATPGTPNFSLQYDSSGTFAGSSMITPDAGVSFFESGFGFGVLENQLIQSNNLTLSTTWVLYGSSGTSITPGEPDPIGGTSAFWIHSVGGNAGPGSNAFPNDGQPYVISFWAKGFVGGEVVKVGFDAPYAQTFTLTNQWARYSATITPTGASHFYIFNNGSSTINWYVWMPQYQSQAFAGPVVATGGGQVLGAQGSSSLLCNAYNANIANTLTVSGPISGLNADLFAVGAGTSGPGTNYAGRIYYDTSAQVLKYSTAAGSSSYQTIATAGGGGAIASKGTFSMSGGSGTITDAAITASSLIFFTVTNPSTPGTYAYSAGTGSASVNSYYVNFGSQSSNSSDSSTLGYIVVN